MESNLDAPRWPSFLLSLSDPSRTRILGYKRPSFSSRRSCVVWKPCAREYSPKTSTFSRRTRTVTTTARRRRATTTTTRRMPRVLRPRWAKDFYQSMSLMSICSSCRLPRHFFSSFFQSFREWVRVFVLYHHWFVLFRGFWMFMELEDVGS